jgi:hypothetical protein
MIHKREVRLIGELNCVWDLSQTLTWSIILIDSRVESMLFTATVGIIFNFENVVFRERI